MFGMDLYSLLTSRIGKFLLLINIEYIAAFIGNSNFSGGTCVLLQPDTFGGIKLLGVDMEYSHRVALSMTV